MRGFYWYLRPIFILSKLFGVMPLQNVHCANVNKLKFQFISLAHLYSNVVFLAVLFAFIYNSNLISLTFNYPIQHQEIHTWNLTVVYVMTVRSALCFLFCAHHSKKLPTLIKKLEMYEKKKHQLLTKKENCIKELFWKSIVPMLNGSFYIIASYFEMHAFIMTTLDLMGNKSVRAQIAAVIFGVLSDWQILPLLLYIYFAYTVDNNFKYLTKELSSHCNLENIQQKNNESNLKTLEALQKTRYLHTLMSSAVKEINHCYGSFMAVDQLCIIIMFVVNLYVFIFISYQNLHLLMCTLINGLLILGVIMISHSIKESAVSILEVLKYMSLSEQDSKIQQEIQLFIMPLACKPIAISAAGYFTMDRRQISSFVND